jgi:DNA-binding transcriptional LysR family regulator
VELGQLTYFIAVAQELHFRRIGAACGAGVALLPRAAKARHASPGIRLVDVSSPEPVFQYALLTHPHDDSLSTDALLDALAGSLEPSAKPAPLSLVA